VRARRATLSAGVDSLHVASEREDRYDSDAKWNFKTPATAVTWKQAAYAKQKVALAR